ncbi:hypothetical protein BGZ81_010229 [Podila clonocystis]|nr:hypothetical protein BGZ81_010229 [Podila clonocystis]
MDSTQSQRHHRRSIDRVWPPALEVRLARLSIDEGSSVMTPHMIIPVPPPVGYEGSKAGLGLSDIPDDEDPCEEEEEGCAPATVEPLAEPSRRGSLAMASPTILELDAAHQQHYQRGQQSQINIKYSNHHHPQSYRKHHERGDNYGNTSGDSNFSRTHNHNINNAHSGGLHTTHQQSLHVQTAKQPMYSASSMVMDTNEFGEDLFNTETVSPAASFHFERPSYFSMPEGRPGVYCKESADNKLYTGSPSPTLPLASSPYHRHGGPLSAPSSKATSRATSPLPPGGRIPLQEKSLSLTNLQQPVANRPASPGLLHLLQPVDPQNSKPTVLDHYLSSLNDETRPRPRSPVPAVMDMMALMEDEQDRWRSPTLSALASRSSSMSPSPVTRSPSRVDSPSSLVARLRRQCRQLQRPRHGQQGTGTGGVDPELLEIPLIEARDEVSLQEIWRMEDEERQDRILNDGAGDENRDPLRNQENATDVVSSDGAGAGHLRKGEQHAHDEARLIQQVIDHAQ